jgi:hypothetical protein
VHAEQRSDAGADLGRRCGELVLVGVVGGDQVTDSEPTAGPQDVGDLAQYGGLVGAEVSTQLEMTTSTEASGSGICSMRPRWTSVSAVLWRANSTISGVESRPMTRPFGPTRRVGEQ